MDRPIEAPAVFRHAAPLEAPAAANAAAQAADTHVHPPAPQLRVRETDRSCHLLEASGIIFEPLIGFLSDEDIRALLATCRMLWDKQVGKGPNLFEFEFRMSSIVHIKLENAFRKGEFRNADEFKAEAAAICSRYENMDLRLPSDPMALKAMLDAIEGSTRLSRLVFKPFIDEKVIQSGVTPRIVDLLRTSRLKSIDFRGGTLCVEVPGLLQALQNPVVKIVHLEQAHPLTPEYEEGVAALLHNNTSLSELRLLCFKFSDTGMQAIFEGIPDGHPLTILSLTDSQLGERGARALAASLPRLRKLSSLNLDVHEIKCDRGGAAWPALMQGMKESSIKHLFLRNVTISSIDEVCDMVRNHGSLEFLDLDGCGLSEEDIGKLMPAVTSNQILTHLSLQRNALTDKSAFAIAEMIRNSKCPRRIMLGMNRFTEKGVRIIALALKDKSEDTFVTFHFQGSYKLPGGWHKNSDYQDLEILGDLK